MSTEPFFSVETKTIDIFCNFLVGEIGIGVRIGLCDKHPNSQCKKNLPSIYLVLYKGPFTCNIWVCIFLCHPVLENANVKCGHHHSLP